MSDLQTATLTVRQSDDGAVQVLFGGRGAGQIALAVGFIAAAVAAAAVAIARARPAGDSPHARTPSSGRSPA